MNAFLSGAEVADCQGEEGCDKEDGKEPEEIVPGSVFGYDIAPVNV